LVKNRNCGKIEILKEKVKFWSKIEILAVSGNFGQNRNCGKNRNSDRKVKFWSKIEILAVNGNFGQQ